jgi:hypothetical protein
VCVFFKKKSRLLLKKQEKTGLSLKIKGRQPNKGNLEMTRGEGGESGGDRNDPDRYPLGEKGGGRKKRKGEEGGGGGGGSSIEASPLA